MKEVKILIPRAGIGFSHSRGTIVDIEDAEADRMVKHGHAEYTNSIAEELVIETASKIIAPEKAVKKSKKNKK